MTPQEWTELRYFKPDETYQRGAVRRRSFPAPEKMSAELMARLDNARGIAGIPFIITSSYRAGDDGAHGEGLAVDIRAHGSLARDRIHSALVEAGFPRRGVYNLHIHGDVCRSRPRGLWGGRSE